ncbi:MAG: hypothetical protein ACYTGP_02570 [Planctomycetota bacterium]|jgi:hypothetical protein
MSRLLDLFSSIRLGVVLLTLLFVYSAIGSAGAPIGPGMLEYPFLLRPDAWVSVRELMEISEFEWFHWWPFDVLIALICLNLVVATLRRIPLNLVNLGVWMIHTGIIVLALGSVWYFSTKVEGDVPVARRMVRIAVPGHDVVTMTSTPGNTVTVGEGDERWAFRVASITPDWELLSGEDAGKRTYKVSVGVRSPTQVFIRELLAGYPQYTEDLMRSSDPSRPFARAKKELGTPLVDETLDLALAYAPEDHFYVMASAALYLREAGDDTWVERPIRGLPRFKDHLASYDDVTTPADEDETPPLRPLDLEVPAVSADDPLPDVTIRVTDYLRYASLRTERRVGGERLDPAVSIRLRDDMGRTQDIQLIAFDPRNRAVPGLGLSFHWISDEQQLDAMVAAPPPVLRIAVKDEVARFDAPVIEAGRAVPFTPIADTPYAYRVTGFQDDLDIQGRRVSVALVEISNGVRRFTRWVFDDPTLTRDLAPGERMPDHAESSLIDPNIEMEYVPGVRPGLAIVAGPTADDLRLLRPGRRGTPQVAPLAVGTPVVVGPGITMTVRQLAEYSRLVTWPSIVPRVQRDRDLDTLGLFRLVRVQVPIATDGETHWLPFHRYAFDRAEDVLLRFPFRPTTFTTPDGRVIEMLYGRARHPLPAAVVLDDFRVRTHIGGYAGTNTSVRDWTSVIRFADENRWTEPAEVSVNAPREHGGFWFFQSQWDPPIEPRGPGDPGSAGLNYTVLGVGNRQGVLVQLAGCCLAVLGMIYAFYVKPAIKRRRQRRVYEAAAPRAVPEPEPVA